MWSPFVEAALIASPSAFAAFADGGGYGVYWSAASSTSLAGSPSAAALETTASAQTRRSNNHRARIVTVCPSLVGGIARVQDPERSYRQRAVRRPDPVCPPSGASARGRRADARAS